MKEGITIPEIIEYLSKNSEKIILRVGEKIGYNIIQDTACLIVPKSKYEEAQNELNAINNQKARIKYERETVEGVNEIFSRRNGNREEPAPNNPSLTISVRTMKPQRTSIPGNSKGAKKRTIKNKAKTLVNKILKGLTKERIRAIFATMLVAAGVILHHQP